MAGAIFDLDGVIVDTAKYHFQAWRRLAAELGYEFTAEHNERLKGVSRMRSLEVLLEVGGLAKAFSEDEKAAMAARKNGWYVAFITAMDASEILDGALDCLGAYRAARIGTALGTASRNASIILDRLGIRRLFDVVVDGTRVSAAKPDPEVFVTAAHDLGLPSASCAVFEDAAAGIEAARRGGMYAVGIGTREVLRQADEVIPGLSRYRELHLVLAPR
jgi:beta-phosphoglucomutase